MASTVVVLTKPNTEIAIEDLTVINDIITEKFSDPVRKEFFNDNQMNDLNILLALLDNNKIKKYLVFFANFNDGTTDIRIFNDELIENIIDTFVDFALNENTKNTPAWEVIRQICQEIAEDNNDLGLIKKYKEIAYTNN